MQSRAMRAMTFTLIELLIVVALLLIIVSFMLPAMDESRIKAKLTGCQGNLNNLIQALEIYRQDNGGTVVIGWDGSVLDASQRTFWAKLKPYYGAEENRACPANPLDQSLCYGLLGALGGRDLSTTAPNLAGTVYLGENTQLAYDATSRHIDAWEREGTGDWELGYAVSFSSDTPTTQWTMRRPLNPFVHRPLVNLGFCDGHVQAMHYMKAWGGPYRYGDPENVWDNK